MSVYWADESPSSVRPSLSGNMNGVYIIAQTIKGELDYSYFCRYKVVAGRSWGDQSSWSSHTGKIIRMKPSLCEDLIRVISRWYPSMAQLIIIVLLSISLDYIIIIITIIIVIWKF